MKSLSCPVAVRAWKEPEEVARFLLETRRTIRVAVESNYPNEWELVGAIIKATPDLSSAVIRAFAADGTDDGFLLIPPALEALRRIGNEGDTRKFVREFSNSPHEDLRVRVADALRYLVDGEKSTAADLDLLQQLLVDKSPHVRRVAIRALAGC
ncbi:MAG: HEAT repeat domain-containing protein [Phycisphaerales bacterium]